MSLLERERGFQMKGIFSRMDFSTKTVIESGSRFRVGMDQLWELWRGPTEDWPDSLRGPQCHLNLQKRHLGEGCGRLAGKIIMVCTWLQDVYSCCCLTVVSGPVWVLGPDSIEKNPGKNPGENTVLPTVLVKTKKIHQNWKYSGIVT